MEFYKKSIDETISELNTSPDGLSSAEAAKRLEQNGSNKLAEAKGKPLFRRFIEQFEDPMIIILLVAAVISGVMAAYEGEGFADVIIIMFVVIVNAVLGVYQENKAEKAIEALQEMSAATSKVLRDGRIEIVKSEELVTGDVILLEAGDAIPADARLIESASLKVEEAVLTGESVPVDKLIDIINLQDSQVSIPLGDRTNMVYMGCTVVYGRAKAVVTATGMDTEMGKIADVLQNTEEGLTPLQIKLQQLSKVLTWLVVGICIIVFAVQLIRAGGFSFEFALDSFMIAVSLAVAAIPEGLVAVVTIVLSVGVTNMSEKNAIVRKLTAVETLGCAQIICSDKTGTLTQNKMTVVDSFGADEKEIAVAMALCSDAEVDESGNVTGEPTEAALVTWAENLGEKKALLKEQQKRVAEIPFDSGRKMMTTVHEIACEDIPDVQSVDSNSKIYIQYTKGALDVMIDRCTFILEDGQIVPMTEERRQRIMDANKAMADKALRVLAVAKRTWNALPDEITSQVLECDLCLIGLSGMIDPVRPEVKKAIEECETAGIRPIMITGDHVDTATAIAKELGIIKEGMYAISGAELDAMSDEEFEKEFMNISVYARVQPEHKTRIVSAWKKAGYVTAMTGDGVNDAPSIKTADIGVGMGITGTDVTKNVADMVLADDNFATIVGAVEEGRRVYDNIRKAIQFLLGSNMSEVLSIFFATLMGFTILKPVHLLWINLVTDCFPALALGMEKAESDIMERKPRSPDAGIFSDGMAFDIVYQGLLVTVLTISSYFIGHYMESGVWEIANSADGITMAFLTMSLAEIFHSFNMRSQRQSIFTLGSRNKMLWGACIGSLIATTAVCEIPLLSSMFEFTSVELIEYVIAVGLAVMVVPVVEIVKFFQRRRSRKLEFAE